MTELPTNENQANEHGEDSPESPSDPPQTSQVWHGLETVPFRQWMPEALNEEALNEEALPVVEDSALIGTELPIGAELFTIHELPPLSVEIIQLRAFQPPQSNRAIAFSASDRAFLSPLRSGEPFTLEITFGLHGLIPSDLAGVQAAYSIEGCVRNRSTKAVTPLGKMQSIKLPENQLSYKALLPEASLQQPGIYQCK
ncbi:MAG: hypothetical protein HC772_02040 [Leptolyngbyaceae cyanobacterium CRU_2_3]|nr:hypothetical protein [Leptolyngbyaceae cyanobacterium CRU_2_3]